MADDRDDELERLRERIAMLEAELARDKAIFEAVFANIPASFYVKDLENRYLYGSPHGFAWFGVDAKKAIGKIQVLMRETRVEIAPDVAQQAAHLQQAIDGYDVFARSLSIGAETMGLPASRVDEMLALVSHDLRNQLTVVTAALAVRRAVAKASHAADGELDP